MGREAARSLVGAGVARPQNRALPLDPPALDLEKHGLWAQSRCVLRWEPGPDFRAAQDSALLLLPFLRFGVAFPISLGLRALPAGSLLPGGDGSEKALLWCRQQRHTWPGRHRTIDCVWCHLSPPLPS